MNGFARRVTRLSAYRKTEDHLTRRTVSGAVVTILGVLAATLLFAYETSTFKRKDVVQQMVVDSVRGERLLARLDVSTYAIPCSVLSLNTLDHTGSFHFNVQQDLTKEVLDQHGRLTGQKPKKLESEVQAQAFGASSALFLTDADKESIKAAVARKEGCRLRGNVVLEKVSGRIHISCNALIIELLIQAFDGLRNVNTSHTIHEFAFGEPYPGSINPLDRYNRITEEPGSFKYFLKVVPTEYVHLDGTVVHTFQYSVTEYYSKFGSDEMMLPGIHFKYDMSAIAVKLKERKTSFLHFLTRLCATIGGAFALTSLANSWVYRITSKFS